MKAFVWVLLSYYVFSFILGLGALFISRAMYKSEGVGTPYRYLWVVLIPYIGIVILGLAFINDWTNHLENIESKNRFNKLN